MEKQTWKLEEEKDAFTPSTLICLFQQSGPKQPIKLHTSPKKKRSRGALALWPSPHALVLPPVFLWVQLNIVIHVLSPVELHCHEDTEEDQDHTTGAANCCCQDADLREGNFVDDSEDNLSITAMNIWRVAHLADVGTIKGRRHLLQSDGDVPSHNIS